MFYDYDKGPASYEAPAGRLDGEILSKWQFKIQNGELVYAFESDTKIDDDILKKELGTNSDVKLKNIVRTIQKEQNAIRCKAIEVFPLPAAPWITRIRSFVFRIIAFCSFWIVRTIFFNFTSLFVL